MPNLTRLALVALVAAVGPSAQAAVVAFYNSTDKPITFAVGHPGKPPASYTLAGGEARLVTTGRQPDIAYTVAGKAARFRLEPYHAYLFSPDKAGVEFSGVDLAGAMPRPNEVPADPPPATPVKLSVALYADDANPRSRDGWEKLYRGRLAAASAILEKQCGVTLAVTTVGDWRSDPSQTDLLTQAKVFEKAVTPPPGTLAVGYLSRYPRANAKPADQGTGFAREPLWPYLLIRDGQLRTESERVEALVRELGHYLGAAHTPDPLSAMRGKTAEGRGFVGRYPVGLDPLNLLAVGIWVEELRAGSPKSMADLKPASRERLAVIYKTLAGLLPSDELAAEHLAGLERVGDAAPPAVPQPAKEAPPLAVPPPKPADPPAVVMPKVEPKAEVPPPAPTPPPKPVADRTALVRKIVSAIRLRAVDLKREPDSDKAKGDALTVELLSTAAEIAYRLDDPMRATAFNIAIGIALDDSDILRNNLLFGAMVRAVESDAERAERVANLGAPTLRGRRDLCQHFVVSATLTELVGPAAAEQAGIFKEMMDRDGVSGFSFADLAADLAGITLAKSLTKFPEAIGRFRDGVNLNDYMPPVTGLKEGLTAARFATQYGGLDDDRFRAELEAVRKRVTDLGKYKDIAELKVK